MSDKETDGYTFKDVLSNELELLQRLRRASDPAPQGPVDPASAGTGDDVEKSHDAYDGAHEANLAGLAFSGGGIRSATFNLGVIQALAKVRQKDAEKGATGLLSRFDYLSTVSGGGYIGSWLSAWLNRHAKDAEGNEQKDGCTVVRKGAVDKLQPRVSTRPCGFGPEPDPGTHEDNKAAQQQCRDASGFKESPWTSGFPPLEHAAIRFLRRYSNYLSPRVGLSGDTLAVVSLFLRNFVLLQIALISLVIVVLLLPYCAAAFSAQVVSNGDTLVWALRVLYSGVFLLLFALFTWRYAEDFDVDDRQKKLANPKWIGVSIFLCILATWLLVISSARLYAEPGEIWLSAESRSLIWQVLGIAAFGYLLAWLVGPNTLFYRNFEFSKYWIGRVVVALVSSLVFGLLTYFCTLLLPDSLDEARAGIMQTITLGPPLILAVLSFSIAVHIGLARHLFDSHEREWWARVGGFAILAATVWLVVFSVSLYTPPLFEWLGNGGFALVIAWAGTSGIGAWVARGSNSDSEGIGVMLKGIFVKAAPWLFIAGLALVISYALHKIMNIVFGAQTAIADFALIHGAIALIVSFALFLLITWRLDINVFSLHSLYRNRLVRAYLGASRAGEREPHPFTGFDMNDDMPLANLAQQRPIHLLNTTINMTGGDDLAWQTRRAASFIFTPHYVGYEAKSSQGTDLGCYRPTALYATAHKRGGQNGLNLGTVLAISGAAASPNMGYNTSAPIAAMLTAFNLRLGYWTGNPVLRNYSGFRALFPPAWKRERSVLCAKPIVSELLGSATAESDWINLSDGGHFDNLGIYELVRRRCRFIVVTDAGCDPRHEFQDLANSIRKCWTDMGVHFYFPDLKQFCISTEDERFCASHGGFGLIEYPDRTRTHSDGETDWERYGLILYLKCSLTKEVFDKFADIRQYASAHETFPHESTGDQWFDENQFEAYRHLGFSIMEQFRTGIRDLFKEVRDSATGEQMTILNNEKVVETISQILEQRQGTE